jgi:hypothetical protein
VKPWIIYVVAAAIGVAAPVVVLAIARETPVEAHPAFAAAGVLAVLAAVAGLLAAVAPLHWWRVAFVVSLPLCLLGVAMFAALASLGEFFWIWLWVGLGGVAASLAAAYGARRMKAA